MTVFKSGQVIDLVIDSLAFGGEGVARSEGFVVFVRGVLPGEKVRVRLTEVKKSFARAEFLSLSEPSPARIEPPCAYYHDCGGCQYQHMEYAEELDWKQRQVLDLLKRIARLDSVVVEPIIPCPEPYGYRNRASLHAFDGLVGFHRSGTREIVDIKQCLLCEPSVNAQLTRLRASQPSDGHYSLRAEGVPPSAFFQTNRFLNQALIELVKKAAFYPPQASAETFIEGYAGGGFFTRELAALYERGIAIESDSRALQDARRLELTNVEWKEGRVEEHVEPILRSLRQPPSLIVMDPPREGLGPRLAAILADSQSRRVIYVSCNPSTLARDAVEIKKAYRLSVIQPIDLFPRTAQIETVSLWERLS